MILLPHRFSRIWCTSFLLALLFTYVPEWATSLTSGPPAVTRHQRLDAPGDGFASNRESAYDVGRALFQARHAGSGGSTAGRGSGGNKASITQPSGSRPSGGEAGGEDASSSPSCKMPATVKPRRAGATSVKPSAEKCSAACRCDPYAVLRPFISREREHVSP
jgi:type IV secretory pathway TrbL component